jgi:hypothetical protein
MAYAGTPTGLTQQAGASRPWKTALAAIAVLAIGLAVVIAVMFVNSRVVAPTNDRSYDQIEAQRGALPAAAMKHAYVAQDSLRGLPPVTPFASEDKPAVGTSSAAFLNAAAAKARAMSGVSADTSLDATVRAAAAKAALSAASGVDKGYGNVQNARGTSQIWSTFDASQVDQTRGAHGPLK